MPGFLLAFFSMFVGLDKAIFYLPVFLSSLSVVPVVVIGYIYGVLELGFFASVIGSLSFAYFSRSFGGFYDTDCLNLFFSLSILACLIYAIEKNQKTGLFLSAIFSGLFFLWYHSSFIIILALYFIYILYLSVSNKKIALLLLITLVSLVFYKMGYFHRVYDYLIKPNYIQMDGMVLKNTLTTVSEAKPISIDKFIRLIAVNKIIFALLFVGYIFFIYKQRSFLLSAPLMLISLLSIKTGARFVEYGVYVLAFGIYIFYRFKIVFYISSLILIFLYSKKDMHFRPKPLFTKQEVKFLRNLKTSPNDFIITWWDYGWSLWYYTNANTLIDNGKHFQNNYVVSKILFTSADKIDETIKHYMKYCPDRYCKILTNIKNQHPNNLKGKIYILFTNRLIRILPTILQFSKIDPFSGKKTDNYYLQVFHLNKINKQYISDNSEIKIDIKNRYFKIKDKKYKLQNIKFLPSSFVSRNFYFKIDKFHFIKYKSYLIICNKRVLNSFILQTLIFKKIPKNMKLLFDDKNMMMLMMR